MKSFFKSKRVLIKEALLLNGFQTLPQAILACSGGRDSMVLLHIMSEIYKNNLNKLLILYVNHQQRADVAEDWKIIKSFCRHYNLRCKQENLEFKHNTKASEVALREKRIECYKKVYKEERADVIFTGHHLQDALETYLFRLLRGAHPLTFKGIQIFSHVKGMLFFRPLLHWAPDLIDQYAKDYSIQWNEDSTNKTFNYTRNRIRHQLLPLFEELHKGSSKKMLQFFLELEKQSQGLHLEIPPHLIKEFVHHMISHQPISMETLGTKIGGKAFQEALKGIVHHLEEFTSAHWGQIQSVIESSQTEDGRQRRIIQLPGQQVLVFENNHVCYLNKAKTEKNDENEAIP